MNILILGYGKMGRAIEEIAEERGHKIKHKININNAQALKFIKGDDVDLAIEFSQPDAAFNNIRYCLEQNIPVVSGTTGWLDRKEEIEQLCKEKNGTFFYASNFSLGVNLYFRLNSFLARMMARHGNYRAGITEIHHTEKIDAPSGTAITLAEGILKYKEDLKEWVNEESEEKNILPIISKREPDVPGTHIVQYSSAFDDLEIKHTAHSRAGFALGAVLVGEWLVGKKGILSMDDFMNF
jgi:4-hydroxy-tetrahydrodipicolinate reductase